ncbi:hypothetical protein GCM10009789_02960 [Kribbella sancticallisti]|uniref:Yip1 domain-containing protein n=1 Tax=Kribbella sancticallisti TaxID=460087 RepID=A0ABN2C5T2_9ACTN
MSEATEDSGPRLVAASDSAGAIYGTIVAMAVIASAAHDPTRGRALELTLSTLCVFWLAHVYADALAHHLQGSRRLDLPAIRAAMADQVPLLLGPLPCLLPLGMDSLGLLDPGAAVTLSLWIGVAQLIGWGVTYARRHHWSWAVAATAGVLNGIFGVLIVILEILIH